MKFKKISLIVFIIVCLFAVASVSASEIDNTIANYDANAIGLASDKDIFEDTLQSEENDELTLTDDGDTLSAKNDADVLGDNPGTYSGLAAEIGSGGNIELQHDYYTYDSGNTIEISIANSVIDGKGAVIDMAGSDIRALEVVASGVIIKNLTIKNAKRDVSGVAIFFSSYGTLTNCKFTDNTPYAGTVYFGGDDGGEVTNCIFSDNAASSNGGAIRAKSVIIDSSRFINNCAEGYGGAVYANKLTLTNIPSYFIGNIAKNPGGAIFTNGFAHDVVSNAFFINNQAKANDDGGAIYIKGEDHVTFSHCIFADNYCGDEGGAIYLDSPSSTISLINNIFKNNHAGDEGHAVFNKGTYGTINDNWWGDWIPRTDNGVLIEWKATTFNIHHVDPNPLSIGLLLSKNMVDLNEVVTATLCYIKSDGSILLNGPYGEVSFSLPENSIIKSRGISQYGKDIDFTINKTGSFDITATLYGQSVTKKLTVKLSIEPITINADDFVENSNTTILINTDEALNGEIAVIIGDKKYNICITNGTGKFDGSGLKIGPYMVNVMFNETETFQSLNKTMIFVVGGGSFEDLSNEIGNGGCINLTKKHYFYTGGSTIQITLNDTVIDGKGAVIDMMGSNIQAFYVNASGVSIKNLTIKNANYDGPGCAIYFSQSGAVENCNFTNNSADYGGAVYFNQLGAVENCNFNNNTATWSGGAVYFNQLGAVENCNFTNNSAEKGGAIYFEKNSTLMNSNFINNTAVLGGAVYFNNEGAVTNCNFADNTVTEDGGAVFFVDNGEVTNCNFNNNTATWSGGAIYFEKNSTLMNSNFTNNTAVLGGAVYFENIDGMSNCNFADNTASNGGAIFVLNGGSLTDCNFTGNQADSGSAIYYSSERATKTVSNSCILNNRAYAESLEVTKNDNHITITFTGRNNLLNAIHSRGNSEVTFNNVTYWGKNGIETVSATLSGLYNEAGQNITVKGLVNGNIINEIKVTDENGQIVLGDCVDYWIIVSHKGDSYYTEVGEKLFANMKLYANVTSVTTNSRTVNITAKSNIYSEVMPGKLQFILPDGTQINATYASNGTWWTMHTFDDYGDYKVNSTYVGLDNVTITNATISISKIPTEITVNNATLDLLVGDKFVIVATVTPEGLNVTFTADDSGVVSVDENGLVIALKEGSATVKVSVGGDDVYELNTTDVKVTVKKIPTGITVNNATLDLLVNDEFGLVVTTDPEGLNVTFTPDDSGVVSVDENGVVTALKEGSATVKVSVGGDGVYALSSTDVKVTVKKIPTKITVNNYTLDLFVGDEFVIVATVNPEGLNVTFTPDDSGVVSVDENGVVTALKEGSVTVKVSVGGDDVYALNTTDVKVTVKKIPTEIIVNNATLDMLAGDVAEGVVSLKPSAGGNLTYISSNPDVVKVEDGKFVAVANGTAIVTVSYAGNDKYEASSSKTIEVTVKYDSKVTISPIDDTVYPNNVTIKYSVENRTDVIVSIGGVSDDKIVVTDDTITVIGLGAGEYTIVVLNNESNTYRKSNDTKTFTVDKQKTDIAAAGVTAIYYKNNFVVITLKDANGNPLTGVKVTVDLNGAKTYTTDKNGQVKVSTKGLAPKAYTAKITFNGNANYAKSTKNIKVTVKKATPKLTAKKKTFKKAIKTKKYTIVLKNNAGKAIKKAKVALKVKGKTFKATTNSKGKAVFKIKNLNKKGTFKATVTYKGNKYYNKVSKKAKIKVIFKFKTVSRGSKDKATVKEIQQALKDHGYYLSYKGHYLKVDGKFQSCTERSVKQFQKAKGLKVTGKVDEKTAVKLGII